jgi:two-component system sensor histidine kinase VicK
MNLAPASRKVTEICDIPWVTDRIIQVLNNLVTNGMKFSPNNSTIEIDAKLEDHSVVFSVKDRGIGIPAEKQGKLFTKFYQVDTALTRKSGGTGLGLAISKGIVEAHKGKIWLESEAGKGSKFSFSIPVGGKVGQ